MCLLIVATKGHPIPKEYVKSAWRNNPDGAGVSYIKDGTLYISKGIMDLETLEATLEEVGDESNRILHFRYATRGEVTQDNTHPFALHEAEAVMAHNGPCVSPLYPGDKERSDSRMLAEDLLSQFNATELRKMKPLLEGFIESGNKLAFLFSDGEYMIVGEKLGTWREGLWLSNTYSVESARDWKTRKYPSTTAPTNVFGGGFTYAKSSVWNSDTTEEEILILNIKAVTGTTAEEFFYDEVEGDYYSYTHFMGYEEFLDTLDATNAADLANSTWELKGVESDWTVEHTMRTYGLTQVVPPVAEPAPVTEVPKTLFAATTTPPVVTPPVIKPSYKLDTDAKGKSFWRPKWKRFG